MFRIAIVFSSLTILVHLVVFVVEAFMLDLPKVAAKVVEKNAANINISATEEIHVLKTLFLNQAFYNLFLAAGGIAGLVLVLKGYRTHGITLLLNMCIFAVGAGVVLASTTTAYPAAITQAGPPFVALICLLKHITAKTIT